MSPELEVFLAAEDLDEVLDAHRKIAILDEDDGTVVRTVFAQWRNPQAVSNLLMHPTLIPEDIRLAMLFHGMYEQKVTYYVLAAVIGFQSIDLGGIKNSDRQHVLSDLLAVMRDTTDILAQRASVSFTSFATPDDASQVFALIRHADQTVRHNIRAWLFRTFESEGAEALTVAGRQSGLTEEVQRQVIEEFADFLTNPPDGFKSPLFPLYGYIPNLRDVA